MKQVVVAETIVMIGGGLRMEDVPRTKTAGLRGFLNQAIRPGHAGPMFPLTKTMRG